MNASDPINALLNYGYAILESMVRKEINTIGLDVSIGYLHEIAPSKHPLVYDLQELFRYIVDYSVIELLETGLKKSDFITTENYHIRLKPNTAKLLIEKIENNFNNRYWSAPLNSETKLSYSVRYILNGELKGVWGEQ
jgi:CRISPR-associated protein Cas1